MHAQRASRLQPPRSARPAPTAGRALQRRRPRPGRRRRERRPATRRQDLHHACGGHGDDAALGRSRPSLLPCLPRKRQDTRFAIVSRGDVAKN